MKLYAKITSERATKGQGGNKYLFIELLAETENGREKIGLINCRIQGNDAVIEWLDTNTARSQELKTVKLKGKNQKSE